MSISVNSRSRLDNLPACPYHRRVMWLVGLGMFFDSFDNTLSGSVLASLLKIGFSTLELNSIFLSATFVGLAIGAALAGWMSDRFGRCFAFQFNLALFGVLAFCCAFAPSMPVLIAIRGLMGIGMGAEYVMCYGLIVELMPASKRGRYLGLLGLFGGFGVAMSSTVGALVIPVFSWRAMFIIAGCGTLCVWWLRRQLPESPRWLEAVGRHEEAEAILQRIEKEAGVTSPVRAPVTATPSASGKTAVSDHKWIPISVLFTRPVIKRTMMAVILNVTCVFGSYSVTGWMPSFFVNEGMTISRSLGFNAAMMAGYIAGPLLCMWLGDRLGRRWGIVLFGTLAAFFAAIYPFMQEPYLIVACGFVLVAMVASFLTLGLGTTPEFFPTAYRFRGGGFAQTVGRIGLISSPFVVLALYQSYGIGGVIAAISGMYLTVTILMAVAGIDTRPETLKALAEQIPENRRNAKVAPETQR